MPIDPEKALGARAEPVETRWRANDVILYHLGLGAGRERPTDPGELRYTYEKNLTVLPTFAVVPGLCAVPDPNSLPGIDVDLTRLLHAEHQVLVARPISTAGKLTSTTRVAEVWDKGKDALVVLEVASADEAGEVQFTNRLTMFLRGEGGFGGPPAPASKVPMPERAPDHLLVSPTHPAQALLYRLSGDPNPLHVDPPFAVKAGFDTPILHGLCSFGMVCKAIVDAALGGGTDRVAAFRARFSGVVLPGDVLTTAAWHEEGRIMFTVAVGERNVLSNGVLTLT
jgi:acyl dehydratase